MTPRNKAINLYEDYFYNIPALSDEGLYEHLLAKKLSLIAVNEILNAITELGDSAYYLDLKNYWQEVKNEINKL